MTRLPKTPTDRLQAKITGHHVDFHRETENKSVITYLVLALLQKRLSFHL